LRRPFESSRKGLDRPAALEVIPFDAPREGKVIANYLVSYELGSKQGVAYRGSFTVYIFEASGKRTYLVKEPYIDPGLRAAVAEAVESLTTWLAPSSVADLDPIGYLQAELQKAGRLASATREELDSAAQYLARDIVGYWLLDPLLRDPEIEDISCEGPSSPVKVWHRRFNATGWLETNVQFPDQERLDAMVSRLVHRSGRSISTFSPIVDSVLPEGYRLAATWGREVTSQGSSFTIRKQRAEPFTLPELVRAKTIDPAIAAYLWLLLDLRGFVVVSGVTASGKTTLLNSLASVLNPSWKIVSIEDTREINLRHSGWKPLHTRSMPGGPSISLFDLVKLSLRERPDFVILGEARGQEVQALFQSAAAGSGCMTTFHSPNLESMSARMTQPPLSVAPSLLDLIDAIVFMVRTPDGARRTVGQVVEMSDRPVTLFRQNGEVWDGTAEVSQRLAMRAEGYGMSSRKLESELERRVQFIDGLVGKGAADYGSMLSDLRRFYGSETLTA
jgi:flagellar protein FlaI